MLSAPVYETTIPRGETLGLRLKFNSDDRFGPPIVIGYKTNCSTIIRSKVDINDTISWFDGKPHFRVPKRCYNLKADHDRMLVVLKTSQVDEDQSGGSYLYFQRMRDNDLKNLSMCKRRTTKDKHRHPLADAKHVESQLNIDVDEGGQIYVVRGLHKKPHAVEKNLRRRHICDTLLNMGSAITNLRDYDNEGEQHIPTIASHWTSRSILFQTFMYMNFTQQYRTLLAEYVLLAGQSKDKRDGGDDDSSRIFIGFGQIQKSSESLHGERMPTFNAHHLHQMPFELQVVLANVLSFSHERLLFFLNLAKEMVEVDKKRSSYVRETWQRFYSAHDVNVDWDFEFVDINMRSEGKLLRHCDYKNDWRPGRDGCVVYSYPVIIGTKRYRVVIVMTSRYTIGAPFEKILTSK